MSFEEPAPEHIGEQTTSRRDALRKAALGSGVAAGVWVAPKVVGLSLEPDFAAAATVMGTFVINHQLSDNDPPGPNANDSNCFGKPAGGPGFPSTVNPASQGNPANPAETPGTGCSPFTETVSIGGEPVVLTWSGQGDVATTSGMLVADFSMMDPPFNNCMMTAVSVNSCGSNVGSGNVSGNTVSFNTVGPFAPTQQICDVHVTVVC